MQASQGPFNRPPGRPAPAAAGAQRDWRDSPVRILPSGSAGARDDPPRRPPPAAYAGRPERDEDDAPHRPPPGRGDRYDRAPRDDRWADPAVGVRENPRADRDDVRRAPEPRTVHIANLSYDTDAEGLEEAFSAYGDVEEARIVYEHVYGGRARSRGFGFVKFETEQAFEDCLSSTDPLVIDGRDVRVSPAQTRLEADTAYVRGIPEGTTREELLDVFPDAVDAKIIREDTDEADGFAFVRFATAAGLSDALAQRTATIQGRQSHIKKSMVRFDRRNRTRRRPYRRW